MYAWQMTPLLLQHSASFSNKPIEFLGDANGALTVSSRQLNQHFRWTKRAADDCPVVITDHGRPPTATPSMPTYAPAATTSASSMTHPWDLLDLILTSIVAAIYHPSR
jgi:hypothetical protein